MLPGSLRARFNAWLCGVLGYIVLAACAASAVSLLTWSIADPSLTHATSGATRNALGPVGAIISDLIMQLLGLAGVFVVLPPVFWALQLIDKRRLDSARVKLMLAPMAVLLIACAASALPKMAGWPLPYSLGGLLGDQVLRAVTGLLAMIRPERASAAAGLFCFAGGLMMLMISLGLSQRDLKLICQRPRRLNLQFVSRAWQRLGEMSERATVVRREPTLRMPAPFPPTAHVYRPAPQPQPVFIPEPRLHPRPPNPSHRPRSQPDLGLPEIVADDDVDQGLDDQGLDRILDICGPKAASRPAKGDEPSNVFGPGYPAQSNPPRSADPIRAARDVRASAAPPAPVQAPVPPHHRADQRSAWPETAPVAPPVIVEPPPSGWRPQSLPGGDDLYGRAVAIVLGDRKSSTDYLQQRLQIGYMRAADLIERMEREGILGAPVYNNMRPILIGGPGSREV